MSKICEFQSHIDDRGEIVMLMEFCNVGSVSLIKSNPDSTRANHYHPNDEHTIFVTEGQIEYFERERIYLSSGLEFGKLTKTILNKGDSYHTKSNFEHTMFFPCYTEFLCFSKLSRNKENYDKETFKIDFDLNDLYHNRIV